MIFKVTQCYIGMPFVTIPFGQGFSSGICATMIMTVATNLVQRKRTISSHWFWPSSFPRECSTLAHFTVTSHIYISVLLPLYRVLAMWTVRAIMNSLKKWWCSPSPCLWWLLRVLSQWAGRRKLKWRQVTWVFHHTLLINNINYFINI